VFLDAFAMAQSKANHVSRDQLLCHTTCFRFCSIYTVCFFLLEITISFHKYDCNFAVNFFQTGDMPAFTSDDALAKFEVWSRKNNHCSNDFQD
jgi:hypothetical protein